MRTARAAPLVTAGLLVAVVGCAGSPEAPPADDPSSSASSPPTDSTGPTGPTSSAAAGGFDQALHDELVGMLERDQLESTGQPAADTFAQREARLAEIFAEHGWPGFDLVGRDGGDAAWAVAQHADLDPAFQARALELLRDAVAAGQASPGNLAYLEDRVAVSEGRPQAYGTQIRCGDDGPVPATPIEDRDGVEQRRSDAGLDPLADYLVEMEELCAQDGAG
ncbi:hypothetical protein FE634_19450 [Nocardioides dongxiaopingii]|uniref:DUF6624 domain-containing protein n=1 Tax=Nocardioides sp. S-1144 TaxID=2582905 RepID=UPI00110F148F|nr:DUF6624 domain-containing protein [Nocardioides sp. S-1144]QCW52042.1 hypothetical protein FE634_19450 [Nocardioides sp. S-1144]